MNPTYESLLPRIEQFKSEIMARWPGVQIEAGERLCYECGQLMPGAEIELFNVPEGVDFFDIHQVVFGDESFGVLMMPFTESKEEVHGHSS